MFKRDTIRKEQRAEFVCVHSTHLFPEAVLLVVHVKSPVIKEEKKRRRFLAASSKLD